MLIRLTKIAQSMAIVLSISIANTKVDCVKPTDRIVFPDDAAVWNAYNAIQAQPMPDYRNTIVQPSPKEYEVITQFTLNLFKESKPNNPQANLILCPVLVALLLSQLESTAVGRTKDELTHAIGNIGTSTLDRLVQDLSTTSHRNELGLATAMLAAHTVQLNKTFVEMGRTRNVDIMNVDFDHPQIAAQTANTWIAAKTKNNILNAVDPTDMNGMRLMLINVLYFRGFWKFPFNETIREPFEVTPHYGKPVTFMKQSAKLRASDRMLTRSGIQFTYVELPYEGNSFCLVLIMPTVRHRLDELVQHLSHEDFADLMRKLDEPYKRLVSLKMPKFTARTSYSLVLALEKMGLQNVFTGESQLPYLTANNERLVVSDIMQQSLLSVDETGTVATSATTIGVIALSITPELQKLTINVDQPFLVTILDKRNQMPLFIGRINDP